MDDSGNLRGRFLGLLSPAAPTKMEGRRPGRSPSKKQARVKQDPESAGRDLLLVANRDLPPALLDGFSLVLWPTFPALSKRPQNKSFLLDVLHKRELTVTRKKIFGLVCFQRVPCTPKWFVSIPPVDHDKSTL